MSADFVADLQNDLAVIDGKKSEQTDDRIEDKLAQRRHISSILSLDPRSGFASE